MTVRDRRSRVKRRYEVSLAVKAPDPYMDGLMACNGNIECINATLDRYGGSFTPEEIALVMGVTKREVKQIEEDAIERIRCSLHIKKLKLYVDM